jgi:hypothetical protein
MPASVARGRIRLRNLRNVLGLDTGEGLFDIAVSP